MHSERSDSKSSKKAKHRKKSPENEHKIDKKRHRISRPGTDDLIDDRETHQKSSTRSPKEEGEAISDIDTDNEETKRQKKLLEVEYRQRLEARRNRFNEAQMVIQEPEKELIPDPKKKISKKPDQERSKDRSRKSRFDSDDKIHKSNSTPALTDQIAQNQLESMASKINEYKIKAQINQLKEAGFDRSIIQLPDSPPKSDVEDTSPSNLPEKRERMMQEYEMQKLEILRKTNPNYASSSDSNSDAEATADENAEAKPVKPFYFPSIQGCRSVEEFVCLNRIEEGTYGVVYRARDKKLDEIVALKRLKMERERDGFPITSLREINTLLKAQHENIVTVREVVVGSNMDKIYIVMEYVEHDLKSLMETMNGPFSAAEVKCLLLQLLRAVNHLHDNWILHRDLKSSNLLLSHKGILKVGDFGLAREYGSPLKHYTEVVVTLWYRAPELLLGSKSYSCPIDLWSVGCLFAEFFLQKVLFPGKNEIDQLNLIFKDLGTPTERIWPGVGQLPGMKKCIFSEYPYNQLRRRFTERQITDAGFDLLNSFLTYSPTKRITAEKALNHQYFNERPKPIDPSMFPSWPAKSENLSGKKKGAISPKVQSSVTAALKKLDDPITIAANLLKEPPPPLGGKRFFSLAENESRKTSGDRRRIQLNEEELKNELDQNFVLKF